MSNPDARNRNHITVAEEPPQVTLKGCLLALAGWAFYTLLYAAFIALGEQIPFSYALTGTVINATILLILMIPAWLINVQQLHTVRGWPKAGLHLITGAVLSVAWFELYTGVFEWFLPQIELGDEFYQNRFWIMLSTFFVYAIVFAIVHMMRSSRELEREEEKLAELRELSTQQEIATLKAQLNPHFLFNTLNSINAYVTIDPDETRQMISNLSDMLRYSLNSFEADEVRLEQEMKFVEKYLELEKKRLDDRLRYTLDVDPGLGDLRIPPMTIQPLVENAVKHGIASQETGGSIRVGIREQENGIHISVEDDGAGLPEDFDPSEKSGIGAGNIDRMLRTRYGDDHGLVFRRKNDRGTEVSFTIPITAN